MQESSKCKRRQKSRIIFLWPNQQWILKAENRLNVTCCNCHTQRQSICLCIFDDCTSNAQHHMHTHTFVTQQCTAVRYIRNTSAACDVKVKKEFVAQHTRHTYSQLNCNGGLLELMHENVVRLFLFLFSSLLSIYFCSCSAAVAAAVVIVRVDLGRNVIIPQRISAVFFDFKMKKKRNNSPRVEPYFN